MVPDNIKMILLLAGNAHPFCLKIILLSKDGKTSVQINCLLYGKCIENYSSTDPFFSANVRLKPHG